MADVQPAKDKLLHDFNAVVADTEELLKSLTTASGEKAQALRATIEQNLKASRERLNQIEQAALDRTRATVRATDEYVRVHPWESIAITAAIAGILGIVVGLLLNRR